MNLVPARYQEQIDRMDRNVALGIGIVSVIALVWVVWNLFWSIYSAVVLSAYGFSPISLVFTIAWTLAIGALAAFNAYVFLKRYKTQP